MRSEPAILIGAAEAAVIAVLGVLAIVLGWDDELAAAVVAAAAAIVALLGAVWTRSQVYSPATYDADMDAALRDKPGG